MFFFTCRRSGERERERGCGLAIKCFFQEMTHITLPMAKQSRIHSQVQGVGTAPPPHPGIGKGRRTVYWWTLVMSAPYCQTQSAGRHLLSRPPLIPFAQITGHLSKTYEVVWRAEDQIVLQPILVHRQPFGKSGLARENQFTLGTFPLKLSDTHSSGKGQWVKGSHGLISVTHLRWNNSL